MRVPGGQAGVRSSGPQRFRRRRGSRLPQGHPKKEAANATSHKNYSIITAAYTSYIYRLYSLPSKNRSSHPGRKFYEYLAAQIGSNFGRGGIGFGEPKIDTRYTRSAAERDTQGGGQA